MLCITKRLGLRIIGRTLSGCRGRGDEGATKVFIFFPVGWFGWLAWKTCSKRDDSIFLQCNLQHLPPSWQVVWNFGEYLSRTAASGRGMGRPLDGHCVKAERRGSPEGQPCRPAKPPCTCLLRVASHMVKIIRRVKRRETGWLPPIPPHSLLLCPGAGALVGDQLLSLWEVVCAYVSPVVQFSQPPLYSKANLPHTWHSSFDQNRQSSHIGPVKPDEPFRSNEEFLNIYITVFLFGGVYQNLL